MSDLQVEVSELKRRRTADRVGAVLNGTDRVQCRRLEFTCRPAADSTDLELTFTISTDTGINWRLPKRISLSVLTDVVDPVGYVHGAIGSMLDTLIEDLSTYPLVVDMIAAAKASPARREEWLLEVLRPRPNGGRG